MDNARRQSKEQKRQRKILNNSLHLTQKSIQESMDLYGIQTENNVFLLGNRVYVKIYTLNTDKEFDDVLWQNFVNILCDTTLYRVRISSFVKGKKGSFRVTRFLTLYIEGIDYAEASEELRQESINLINALADAGIQMKECSINTVLMFIHLNLFGEVKNINIEKVLHHRENLYTMLFPEYAEENGYFILKEQQRYGVAFQGEEYTGAFHDAGCVIDKLGFGFQSCVDIQAMTEEENKLFEYALKKKYNYKYRMKDTRNINLSFLLSLVSDNEVTVAENANKMKSVMNIPMYSYTDRHSVIHSSICSLGIMDYHKMRNVQKKVASGLIV